MKFICSKCGYSGDGPDFPHPRSFDGRDCSYVARRAPKFVATDRAPQIPEPAVDATRLLAESQAHNAKLEAQVERLRAGIETLYDAGQWGINHVGMANYAERQEEAEQNLEAVYLAALKP